ncbi:MAG TPA: hypothetical protein VGX25_21800 [Actinophytocola sp.]|uniref:hypothetical protein n=1 Tax=Actinophytocola sp. TaxID=1872138 RepID=UPI002DDCD792|nr:hypothetical protein [Actinophytocola sp.]HEV2782033.1 hypothetical protein [Actinophytocola sp.]
MSAQREVVAALTEAGVLDGIRWAYRSATAATLEIYSEEAGFDHTWAGMTRFTLFRDRLDRVFACDRYAVRDGGDATVSLDLLHAHLTELDIATMPDLPTDLVERADLNGSPGWAWRNVRWLLASVPYGRIDQVPWTSKSLTKQRVALQRNPDPAQPSLFDGAVAAELGGLEALLVRRTELDRTTLVVAHSQDVDHGDVELALGWPRLNVGGGAAWHWYEDLLRTAPAEGARRYDGTPLPAALDTSPDAPVQLRRHLATGER